MALEPEAEHWSEHSQANVASTAGKERKIKHLIKYVLTKLYQ